jgi:hypothetical protein
VFTRPGNNMDRDYPFIARFVFEFAAILHLQNCFSDLFSNNCANSLWIEILCLSLQPILEYTQMDKNKAIKDF